MMSNRNKIIISLVLVGTLYYFLIRSKIKEEYEFQIRNIGGADVYYKRKVGDVTWLFSSKEEYENNGKKILVNAEEINLNSLPVKVTGSYKARNCDELHAFQSTHGKIIGNLNTKVNAVLKQLYNKGINPDVTDVNVVFDTKNMISNWEVTIDKSKDGKAYLGITSRGSSGDSSAYDRAYKVKGQRTTDIINSIKKTGETDTELKLVKDWLWNLDKNKKVLGKCPTRQLFYKYTLPKKYPAHKK
jgi:hypothetical protein